MVKMDYGEGRRYMIEINGRRIFDEIIDNSERIARLEERMEALESKISLIVKFLSVVVSLEVSILIALVTIFFK